MNLELLRDVRNMIAANPSGFNMGTWVSDHLCGTTCCIAGHAYFLSVGRQPSVDTERSVYRATCIPRKASRCLRINHNQGMSLFFSHQWPESFLGDGILPSLEAAIELLDRLIDGRITLAEDGEWIGDLEYSHSPPAETPAETCEEQVEECVHSEAIA